MEVYTQIKKDLGYLIILLWASYLIVGYLDINIDNTDKDGFNRSNIELITDYGTGNQYLYRSGTLIPRLDKNGNQINIKKGN